jgi:DNA-binding SARP family transcriptional activator/TolB-like protein
MLTLRLLGGISLKDEAGHELDALLRQPKHVALLAYLAMPKPGAWHRRDAVLLTFWPDVAQARARSSLRSALHTLRRHLPEGAVASRGDDELSIAPEVIETDVALMSDDFTAGRFADALERYVGMLLPNLYVPEAQGFDKWLDQERRRVLEIARKAATQLSIDLENRGDLDAAIDAAKRAADLDPDDESAARRWIALLDRAGDRSQAFAVYDRFRNHMWETFGVRPSAETVALLDAIRTRHELSPRIESIKTQNKGTPSPAAAIAPPAATSAPQSNSRRSFRKWWWLAAPVAMGALVLTASMRMDRSKVPAASSRSLVILPMLNETGDSALAYVGTGIAEGVARRLEGIGGIRITSGARSDWKMKTTHDIEAFGRDLGSTLVLRTALRRAGDSMQVEASVVDVETREERVVTTRAFSAARIRDVESMMAADIAGTVFRAPLPSMTVSAQRKIDPESYRLMLEARHVMLSSPRRDTGGNRSLLDVITLFTSAVDRDPMNAAAWAGLSSVWASQALADRVPFDDGYDRATAAATRALALDSMQGAAWANLGLLHALKYRDRDAGLKLIRKAEAVEPSNPEIFLVKGVLYRYAQMYDEARDALRVARKLDPLSSYYPQREANTEFCLNRPEAALELFQKELQINPSDVVAQAGITRALAMLGRYDEAIASWRIEAAAKKDARLISALGSAKGASGYWSVNHLLGKERITALEKTSGFVSPLRFMQAHFAAGNADEAFKALAEAERRHLPALYRLRCMPDVDEFRNTPRFTQAVARIGHL